MHYACDTEGDNQHDDEALTLLVEELRGVARKLSSADSASLPKLCKSTRQRLVELVDRIGESFIAEDSESDDVAEDDEWRSQNVPRAVDAPVFNGRVRENIQSNGRRARKEACTSSLTFGLAGFCAFVALVMGAFRAWRLNAMNVFKRSQRAGCRFHPFVWPSTASNCKVSINRVSTQRFDPYCFLRAQIF